MCYSYDIITLIKLMIWRIRPFLAQNASQLHFFFKFIPPYLLHVCLYWLEQVAMFTSGLSKMIWTHRRMRNWWKNWSHSRQIRPNSKLCLKRICQSLCTLKTASDVHQSCWLRNLITSLLTRKVRGGGGSFYHTSVIDIIEKAGVLSCPIGEKSNEQNHFGNPWMNCWKIFMISRKNYFVHFNSECCESEVFMWSFSIMLRTPWINVTPQLNRWYSYKFACSVAWLNKPIGVFENYRPISNTPMFAKLFERILLQSS